MAIIIAALPPAHYLVGGGVVQSLKLLVLLYEEGLLFQAVTIILTHITSPRLLSPPKELIHLLTVFVCFSGGWVRKDNGSLTVEGPLEERGLEGLDAEGSSRVPHVPPDLASEDGRQVAGLPTWA